MGINIAINGFGRIGRLAFRQLFNTEGYRIAAINDLTSPQMLAHLLKYDTTQGCYDEKIGYNENSLTVNGVEIPIYAEKDPRSLPWKELQIDVVLECTGFFASKKASAAHIEAGAKKVLISTAAGKDVSTIVYGVNEHTLTKDDTIVSAASCTTNCLAPMAYYLNELAPIKTGFMTTIHAYTNDQNTLDGPHAKGDLRRARSAAGNIIPTSTGAAKAIGLVIPALDGKLDGTSQRVPIMTGSLTELTAVVDGSVTVEQVNEKMEQSQSDEYGYTDELIVSSDIIGMTYGGLFDATQTKVSKFGNNTLVKIAAWYDNENSFTSQMIRTAKYLAKL
ncbi:type I glyceraldehyde-3-phosphate dehydrogenase [Anaerocolumna sedimenticola]|uniref:Glyceraldehyde-3-phosphate dehydrogenase n=1 Tax=Anaerocolumna sedimenticola TaxID=2696063 RepID=A0A6P1TMQ5_9FIRM|nr:type I glyceraldehyde-3-phosphate dehydrogenase [Anaerocolumna sedimenticola]QHQ60618.1 type I glyceraldehyde-3-phosphate dehydrogenase [Anaerocolumna sedimenticola]